MKFPVIVTPGEDGYLVAECPTLPGCVTQGRTEEEALANVKEAIAGWIEAEVDKVKRQAEARVLLVDV